MTYGGQGMSAADQGPAPPDNRHVMPILFGLVVIVALVVAIVVVVTDDGDEGASSSGSTTTSPGSTSSTTPETTTTTTAPTSEGGLTLPASSLTASELNSVLLTPEDLRQLTNLPWTWVDDEDVEDGPNILDDPDLPARCVEAFNLFRDRYDEGQGARITHVDDSGDTNFVVTQSLYLVEPGDPNLAGWLADYETCSGATYTDPRDGEVGMEFTVHAAFTDLGEESSGFSTQMSVSEPVRYQYDWTGIAFADRGVVSIVNMGESVNVGDGQSDTYEETPVDPEVFRSIVERSYELLTPVLE